MSRPALQFSKEELAFLKRNRALSRRELHEAFVRRFQRADITFVSVKYICWKNGWTNGHTGQFTSLSPKLTYKPVGSLRTWDGYIQRKITDEGPMKLRWRNLHLINFEAANGPLPEGHVLKCLDGNTLNTDASNWKAVPKGLLIQLNGGARRSRPAYDSAPVDLKPAIMAAAQLEYELYKLRRRKS